MSDQDTITVRRMAFPFPARLDPVLIEGSPEESHFFVAVSLLLPYLEPYLIRSMREAKKRVTDPALLANIDLFNAQEGQHYRQHMRFNEAVRPEGLTALQDLEAELAAEYLRFTKERSLRFNLAYAEGFEAFTTAVTRFGLETRLFDRLHPASRDLFQWHMIEELEHRTVVFDVYDHVCGGYLYRLAVGLFAQWHLNRFTLRASQALKGANPAEFRRKYGGWREAWARLRPLLWLALRVLLPKVLWTYTPWYTPHAIALPEGVRAQADHYTEMALATPTAGK